MLLLLSILLLLALHAKYAGAFPSEDDTGQKMKCANEAFTIGTCCKNDYVIVTGEKYRGQYLAYVCGYKTTGVNPDKCNKDAVAICCNAKTGYITPLGGDGGTIYTPEDFRCEGLDGNDSSKSG